MLEYYDVAVVFGGVSNEHEVSVITGTMVCNVLCKAGKRVLPFYISRSGEMFAGDGFLSVGAFSKGNVPKGLAVSVTFGGVLFFNSKGKFKGRAKIGCALNCCHGGSGEGGGVAGLFELNGVPFASAGLFESAAFIDKYYTKLVLKSLGEDIAEYCYSRDIDGAIAAAEKLGYPVIVKPCKLGSSIGIAKAGDVEELKEALEVAFALDDGVIIEEYLSPRREFNCAAYYAEGRVVCSPVEEVFAGGELLSYDDKYSGGGRRQFPADISKEQESEIKGMTERVYGALSMRGVVRFDFIMCGERIVISEINTVPGSLSQYLISESYSSFGAVLLSLIKQAQLDMAREKAKLKVKTGILDNLASNACKLK